jgi:DNA-binding response OmpR family regulator
MSALPGHLVLIVDPDERLRALFRDLFTLEGYAVEVLSDIQPGSLREYSPAAVVYGLGFGDEADRISVLHGLLADGSRDGATIVCTADPTQVTTHQTALDSLGIPIVRKPFDIEELLGIIQNGVTAKISGDGRLDGPTSA